jgi:four helix bundle protein
MISYETMDSYRNLEVWKVGIELVKEVYTLTTKFPKEELYGLVAQMKRASTSILANIAEGAGRYTYADKANKFIIARGECSETEAFLFIAVELNLLKISDIKRPLELIEHERKLLSGLIASCRRRNTQRINRYTDTPIHS